MTANMMAYSATSCPRSSHSLPKAHIIVDLTSCPKIIERPGPSQLDLAIIRSKGQRPAVLSESKRLSKLVPGKRLLAAGENDRLRIHENLLPFGIDSQGRDYGSVGRQN